MCAQSNVGHACSPPPDIFPPGQYPPLNAQEYPSLNTQSREGKSPGGVLSAGGIMLVYLLLSLSFHIPNLFLFAQENCLIFELCIPPRDEVFSAQRKLSRASLGV